MAKRLYIGGLPFETTEDELRDLLAEIGTVESVSIITDKTTGRSRGFAFVEMSSEEDVEAAAEQLDGKDFMGRRLTVNEARPMEERGERREGGGGGRGRRRRNF